MNCLEFRRVCLTDPSNEDESFLDHRADCGECGRFASGLIGFDVKLKDAMKVPVPDGLAERIKMRQVLGGEQDSPSARPWQYALAASLFLSVTVGGLFGYRLYSDNQYTQALQVAVLDHAARERNQLAYLPSNRVTAKQVNTALNGFGGKLVGDLGSIRQATVCEMNKRPIVHLVMEGEQGHVTVMYLSQEKLSKSTRFRDQNYDGMLVPAGRGSMAVLGKRDEPIEEIVKRLKAGIRWNL